MTLAVTGELLLFLINGPETFAVVTVPEQVSFLFFDTFFNHWEPPEIRTP